MARLEKIFGFAFGVLIQLLASVGSSYGVCLSGLVLHQLKNSEGLHEERCCLLRKCRPGSRPVICGRVGRSAGCLECDNGQYQDAEVFTNSSKTCYPHTPCIYGKGLKLFTPGNSTSDNVCICDSSRGFQPKNKGLINQKSCSCASGFEWDDKSFWCKEVGSFDKQISNITVVTNSGLEPPVPKESRIDSSAISSVVLIASIAVVLVVVILGIVAIIYCCRKRIGQARRNGSRCLNKENSSGTNSDTSSLLNESGAAQVVRDEGVKTEAANIEDETTKAVQCTQDSSDIEPDTYRKKSLGELNIDRPYLYSAVNSDTNPNDAPPIEILHTGQVSGTTQDNSCPAENGLTDAPSIEVLHTGQLSGTTHDNSCHTENRQTFDPNTTNPTVNVPPGNVVIVTGDNSNVIFTQNYS